MARSTAREAIVNAYKRLVSATRRARPPVTHLLREAGVSRSTFYKHFDDRDAVLLEAMQGALAIVAEAATSKYQNYELAGLLDHFREQRRNAPEVFEGRFGARMMRALATQIMVRTPEIERNDALRLAETQIAYIRLWLSGETPEPAAALASKMSAAARTQRSSL